MKTRIVIIFSLFFSFYGYSQSDSSYKNRLAKSMDPAFAPFYHGVASGDALSDRVIIWTRVTPLGPIDSILVEWKVATDTLFNNVVLSGSVWTKDSRDYTVKVDVIGLQPNTWYYYHFRALNTNSLIGRTRSLPVGDCDSLRFAALSGSNYNSGYFNVYRTLNDRNDIDAVIHLGDYIYEYGTNEYGDNPDRGLEPNNEVLTLSDYRMRYSHYRLDPDLRVLHQQYPWYVEWDDHETANNSYAHGAENHDTGSEGSWETRKNAGVQAFLEWLPVREINDPLNPENHIHRTIKFGDLASMIFVDTRLEGRSNQDSLGVNDPQKTMLGAAQYTWFTNELLNAQFTTPVRWKILANQVMFAPLQVLGQVVNTDQWDGYNFERQRILDFLYGWGISNFVVITGDIHTSWASDVPNSSLGPYGSNGQGSACVEFVTPSVTSPSIDFGSGIGAPVIQSFNPHMKWIDLEKRGYFILDVNKNRVQADWFFVNDIGSSNGFYEYHAQSWYVNNNEKFLRSISVPAYRYPPYQPFAPSLPNLVLNPSVNLTAVILGVYPNPFNEQFTIQYFIPFQEKVKFTLFDVNGKIVQQKEVSAGGNDLDYIEMNPEMLPAGSYILKMECESSCNISRIVKTK